MESPQTSGVPRDRLADASRLGVGFTLIELLVVIAVIAILVGILLPALARARESGRGAVCLSNEHGLFIACRSYADDNRGIGPALGVPYTTLPNWALVVQAQAGMEGDAPTDMYSNRSILVCPTADAVYPAASPELRMVRTYAINATGHAGLPGLNGASGDPDNYDAGNGAAIGFDRILFPSLAALFVDSQRAPVTPPQPPSTRTASPIDFRQTAQLAARLARFHAAASFNAGMLDGSAANKHDVAPAWLEPLP